MAVLYLVLLSFIFVEINVLNAGGGSGWAAPAGLYGPISRSNTGVFGSPGLSMCYNIQPNNNASPLVCCEVKGYDSYGSEQWSSTGCGYSSITGCVNWGNNLATPAVKCKGI
eukprot:709854_1